MSITLKTRKMLWGRSGNRCAIPTCRKPLVEDESETDNPSIVGDESHIVAKEENGPRGKSELAPEERDKYDNLILLCKEHHKIVDDQPNKYTVALLKKIKVDHTEWVSSNLDIDAKKLKEDEIYASYIDKWLELADLNGWEGWSSFVLSGGQPEIRVSKMEDLNTLNRYLVSRVWPKRYNRLEIAFHNFSRVLNDFRLVFKKYAIKENDTVDPFYSTEKFYKRKFHDQKTYHELLRKYEYHVDLVQDLMLELTRAVNKICDEIRNTISPSFRLNEGAILVTSGPHMDFNFKTCKPEYFGSNEDDIYYPSLRKFMDKRIERDYHYGSDLSNDYFINIFEQ